MVQSCDSFQKLQGKHELCAMKGYIRHITGLEGKLVEKENTLPRFFNARFGPDAIGRKKKEVKLVKEGILQPIELVEWAAPIALLVTPISLSVYVGISVNST